MKALAFALLLLGACAPVDETFIVTAPNVRAVVKVKAGAKVTAEQARVLVEQAVNEAK